MNSCNTFTLGALAARKHFLFLYTLNLFLSTSSFILDWTDPIQRGGQDSTRALTQSWFLFGQLVYVISPPQLDYSYHTLKSVGVSVVLLALGIPCYNCCKCEGTLWYG